MKIQLKAQVHNGIWLFILIGFLFMLLELLISGRIVYLLHPRMYVFVWAGCGMLLAMIIHQMFVMRSSKLRSKRPIKWGYIIFIVPLLLAATRPQTMAADLLSNKPILLGQGVNTSVEAPVNALEGEKEPTTQVQSSDPFYSELTNLQATFKNRIGETMSFSGLVFRQDRFSDQQLVVARLLITCCASDAGVMGILVEGDESLSQYSDDSWVEVTGTISNYEYKDEASGSSFELPMLKLQSIKSIEPFDNPYVYPNG